MDPRALEALICPHCAEDFPSGAQPDGAIICAGGHGFDIARQGYINLLTGHGTSFTPDTADMVQARAAFLAAGHYEPLAAALAGVLRSRVPAGGRVLDAGTGTGYYLNRIRRDVECSSVAIDISKFALRRAARSNPGALNLAWDVWRPLPLAAGAFDAVTVVFAPRNPAEFARVLRPGGTLVVVTPLPAHLAEIAAAAGLLGQHEGKQLSLARSLADGFLPGTEDDLVFGLELGPAEVRNAAMMGPAGHHSDPADLAERTAGLPARSHATAAVRISTFLRRPGPAAA